MDLLKEAGGQDIGLVLEVPRRLIVRLTFEY